MPTHSIEHLKLTPAGDYILGCHLGTIDLFDTAANKLATMEFDVRSTPERPRAVFSHVDGRGRVFVLECARPGSAVRPEPGSTQVACLALRTP